MSHDTRLGVSFCSITTSTVDAGGFHGAGGDGHLMAQQVCVGRAGSESWVTVNISLILHKFPQELTTDHQDLIGSFSAQLTRLDTFMCPVLLDLCSPELPCSPGTSGLIPVCPGSSNVCIRMFRTPGLISWVFNPFIKNACWMKGFTYQTGQRFRVASFVVQKCFFSLFFIFITIALKEIPIA